VNIWVLGKGKTGGMVAEVARERGHQVRAIDSKENAHAAALTSEALKGVDMVIDFTAPDAVVENIEACCRAGADMVVGTTGWGEQMSHVRQLVEQSYIAFLFASNFSVGVNLFYDIARAAAAGLQHGYTAKIVERHHAQKKDQPSGTAIKMKKIVQAVGGDEVEITSIREGDTVGTHVLLLDSEHDTMMLTHDAKSRRGFAEGAVLGAEWLKGKEGFFDFKDVWQQVPAKNR
jgi:4-hydroxy-tetrahydrodipicolinate reductase